MKKIIYTAAVTAISILLFSCQPKEDANALRINIPDETPTELGDLRNMLAEAKQNEKGLQDFIKQLEEKVEELDTTKVKKVAVTAKTPIVEDFKSYAEVQSTVQAEQSVMASSETGGRLVEMKWEEGQYIKKGDLVARTDMEQVDKQLAELYTRLELAQTVLTKRKRLWDQNIGSEIEYLQAKNNVDVLNKSIETVKFQQTKANVYSPASGIVDRVMTKQGEMAGPGAPILMIMNTSQVKVVAGVPEKYLKAVRKGQMVKVKFPSLDEERNARVSMIGRTLNAANRTFEVEVTLSNPRGILKPNLMALMMINDETVKNAVMVPEELIRQDVTGMDFVYTVDKGDEDGQQAKKVYVTTGSSSEGSIVVSEGLKGDELIIAEGGRGLSEGQYIEVEIVKAEKEEENNG